MQSVPHIFSKLRHHFNKIFTIFSELIWSFLRNFFKILLKFSQTFITLHFLNCSTKSFQKSQRGPEAIGGQKKLLLGMAAHIVNFCFKIKFQFFFFALLKSSQIFGLRTCAPCIPNINLALCSFQELLTQTKSIVYQHSAYWISGEHSGAEIWREMEPSLKYTYSYVERAF